MSDDASKRRRGVLSLFAGLLLSLAGVGWLVAHVGDPVDWGRIGGASALWFVGLAALLHGARALAPPGEGNR